MVISIRYKYAIHTNIVTVTIVAMVFVKGHSSLLPAAGVTLSGKDVHIWQISLSGQGSLLSTFRNLLAADEIQRAGRFFFERDRERFIVARAAMRQIVGDYVNIAAERLVFSYGAKGKPELAPGQSGGALKFNLSHSGEYALLALSQGLRVGVDIEFVNADFAGEEIAERFFSSNEIAALQAMATEARAEAFFSCWTRKEAYIKALGEGLSIPLDSFDVAFGPHVPAALLRVRGVPDEVTRWSVYDIAAPTGYKAALVAEGKEHKLRHGQWNSPLPRLPAVRP